MGPNQVILSMAMMGSKFLKELLFFKKEYPSITEIAPLRAGAVLSE